MAVDRPSSPSCDALGAPSGTTTFAPYIDVTVEPPPDLASIACTTGIHDFSLAFFTGKATTHGCEPTLAGSAYKVKALRTQITTLRSLGGDVIGSFGGAAGRELAEVCTTRAQLEAAYQSVISYYGLTQLDFDIEGNATFDTSANARRFKALAALETADQSRLHISLTLPVEPQGLPAADRALVGSAISDGLPISVVNVMTMDFGNGPAPDPAMKMGDDVLAAARATETELAVLYPSDTEAQLWSMIGVTPMIGQNDTRSEIFTTQDAAQLATFAAKKQIGRLAMWSVARDNPCSDDQDVLSSTCSGVAQAPWAFSSALLGG